MYAVMGITGRVGGAAARELLRQGKTVRTLVRDPKRASEWAARGVEVQEGDWNDPAAVASAIDGAEGAYLMVPPLFAPKPGFPEAQAVIASYQEALRRTRPGRVVVLSSIGSEKTSGLGLITQTHMIEQGLKDVDVPIAFVRAGSFFENYVALLETAAATGILYSFYAPVDRNVPMIATEDIGKEVAKLLTTDWSGKRIIELGSPASPNEVAQAAAEVLGRSVIAQAVPRERWSATIESFGLPAGGSGPYEEMCDSINSGWITFGAPGTERVDGTTSAKQVFEAARKNG